MTTTSRNDAFDDFLDESIQDGDSFCCHSEQDLDLVVEGLISSGRYFLDD